MKKINLKELLEDIKNENFNNQDNIILSQNDIQEMLNRKHENKGE